MAILISGRMTTIFQFHLSMFTTIVCVDDVDESFAGTFHAESPLANETCIRLHCLLFKAF